MLLGARLGMSGGGASPLPYDAEVEYLESTGLEYVDLGINISKTTQIQNHKISISSNSVSSSYSVFTGYENGIRRSVYLGYYGKFGFWNGITSVCLLDSYVNDHPYKFVSGNGSASIFDGDDVVASVSSTSLPYTSSAYTTKLFAGTYYSGGSAKSFITCRWYCSSVENVDGGDLVLDLIPVRVGQVGYMYDRVSGELFGNSGTGDFIIGPHR